MSLAVHAARSVDASRPAGHLTPKSDLGWSFWREVECRTAGFPVDMVMGFSHRRSAETADELNAATLELEARRGEVLGDLRKRLNQVRIRLHQLDGQDPARADVYSQFILLKKLAKKISKGHTGPDLAGWLDLSPLDRLTAAAARHEAAARGFEKAFADARIATHDYASRLVQEEPFCEAVVWQNLAAFRQTIIKLLDPVTASQGGNRKAEALVASYIQRYCTKNDTIGFFGPEGWARFDDDAATLTFVPGPRLLATRRIYFEDWAIRAFADQLSADRSLLAWQIPRRMAHLHGDGVQLCFPGGARIDLSDAEAAVFAACDGRFCAADIAASLCANPFLDFGCEADVYAALDSLARQHRIDWRFDVRVGDAFPESHLRLQLERIGDGTLRSRALGGLDELEHKRAALTRAAGNSVAVADALCNLNAAFEALTGTGATRNHGQTYGARTIVYEDCRRDMRVELGRDLRARLQAPLDLIHASARWYCHEQAARVMTALKQAFLRCGAAVPRPGVERSVEFADFWPAAQAVFASADTEGPTGLQHELISRWERLLAFPDPAARDVAFSSAALRDPVQEAFAVRDCGWAAACHQSADVLIAARSAAAIAAGDYSFVLGELHMGWNTLINQSAVNQHPDPDVLLESLGCDLAAPRVIPLFSREGTQQPIRVQGVTRPGIDVELCFSHDARPLNCRGALSIGSMVVELVEDGLSVCDRDGRHRFGVLHVFAELLSNLVVNRFRMFGLTPHTPRVAIDRLVIQRESWRMQYASLDFAFADSESAAFCRARRWCGDRGLPERVFVKVPWDQKPFYVDFASPVLVRLLCRQIRGAVERGTKPETLIVLSEMLPSAEDTWLADSEGRRFTSELRMVAVHDEDRAHRGLHR